ncbi:hypothetical protein EVJ29_06140 [Exiguobacterium sp. SH4S7]|uniref:hypothetical protein n=1 Tax=Exiguobacterium TaxID=33986 RepID=UPI000877A16A|nr:MULTISPECIES: hypothetical protein [Exiguobacterium]TCI37600.1 hypothetical protein EVJ29_06140 [Exiguobacterium sp. SH4S7]
MEKEREYPFPGNWSRLQKMIQEADAAGERQRVEPILWDWYAAVKGDQFIFMEIFQCLMERPEEPETLEKLEELVTTQIHEAEEPAAGGLQIAQYYIMRDQPFEAAHWIHQYLEWQDKADQVNTQAYQVLQVLKMTEFPAAIAKLKRTVHRGSVGEQIELLEHVHFNIDDVLDNVLKGLLLEDRPKLMKLIVLEKAFEELSVIEWVDLETHHRLTQAEAQVKMDEWEHVVHDLQKAVKGDEIATQLLMNYMYTHYPFTPGEASEIETAVVRAKAAILNDEETDGLAAEILEADIRFTQAFLD